MALLMAFFVMLVAAANQDKQKLADAAGSLKEAFGVQPEPRRAGMIERDGLPVRQFLRDAAPVPKKTDASTSPTRNETHSKQGPESDTHDFQRAENDKPREFLTAAASLRQALNDLPDVAEASKHVVVEETQEGLNIRIVDQEGRSMFPEGSRSPYEYTRQIISKLAPVIARMPHRIRITGHTAGGRRWVGKAASPWDISSGRAAAIQELMAAFGVGHDRFDSIIGKADSDPLFPNEPFLAANRRVDILLMHEAPPLPNSMPQ